MMFCRRFFSALGCVACLSIAGCAASSTPQPTLAGIANQSNTPSAHKVDFKVKRATSGFELQDKVLNIGVTRLTDRSGRKWTAYDPEILNSRHVASAVAVPALPDEGRFAQPRLKVVLSPEGHAVLEKATGQIVGQTIVVLLDGEIRSVAVIRSAITSGSLQLSIDGAKLPELERLAQGLGGV